MTKQTVILLLALGLAACGTVNTIPLDDAYIWPDKKEAVVTQTTQTTEVQSEPAAQPAPTMEIISQQDTTITVRIKK